MSSEDRVNFLGMYLGGCENVPSLRRDKLVSLLYPRTHCLSRSGVYSNRPLRGDGLKMVETAGEPEELPPVDSWIGKVDFRSTAEVKIPERLVDQVIGQEHAVEEIRKASEQKRHVMWIEDPVPGKTMPARSLH